MLTEKIGVIGAGKIGSAIARGIIRAGLVNKESVMSSDVSDELRQAIARDLDIKVTPDNGALCDFAEIIILAVKPQIVDPVAREIAKKLGKSKLLVSVAAGVPLGRIETHLERGARVVRVMPNIPCVIGAGAAGVAGGGHATAADLEKSARLHQFGVGLAVEENIWTRSGSCSGPAYFLLWKFRRRCVQVGLSRDVALKLAMQTVYAPRAWR